jgi:predicted nucleotidyltransferase
MKIEVPQARVEEFCRKWKISEFALFGSVLRDDFRPDSDVDVLVTFVPGAEPGYRDLLAMEGELREIVGREVDLVEKEGIVNPFRKHHIQHHHRVLYAA